MSAVSLSRACIRALLAMQGRALPAEVTLSTRLHLADSVGISLAARGASGALERLLDALAPQRMAASDPCGLLGGTERLSAPTAAFANAALAHVLDFDDIHDLARLHPTTVTFAAALAAADMVGASMTRVVSAVTLGNELMCRLGLLCSPTSRGPGADWFLTQLFGYSGAALSAGLVLGLAEDQLVSALGLAYMQSAGGKEAGFGVGSDARAIYPAFAAMGGVTAALLARAGLVGPEGAFDGEAGLLRIYLGTEPTPALCDRLLSDARWHASDISFKPWPCCRLSHPYVAAALALHRSVAGRPIERVVVEVNGSADRLCHPPCERRRPATLQDAKYSIPFMTAFALVHGRVELANLGDASLSDQAVLALADRLQIVPGLPDRPGHPPVRMQVVLADEALQHSADRAGPLDLDAPQVMRKFASNAAWAGHTDPMRLWSVLTSDAHADATAADLAAAARLPRDARRDA